MMGAHVGAVEILGTPAVRGEGERQVKFKEKDYTSADQIMVGCGGLTSVAAGATVDLVGRVSSPFRPEEVCIPSDVASSLVINSIKIGPFILTDGSPVAADIFTEVSLLSRVDWPEAQVSQEIIFNVTNTSLAAVVPRITLRGTRLR